MNKTSYLFLLGFCLLAGPLSAVAAEKVHLSEAAMEERLNTVRQDAKATEAAIKAAQKVTFFCANCHGDGGNSNLPEVPNLAGQNASYLLEQIHKFGDGRRRNEFMQGLIKALSDEEKISVSVYYASMGVKPAPVTNKALVAQGKALFFKICQRCHGEAGRGSNKIARLAGQKFQYVSLSLTRYRDGTGERLDPLMAANAKILTDAEINSLATYISTME
ncbi:MAG: c-type cytochrome [Sulfuricella sp.]|nr:c-type cytochrome [Sulfuricella sp.]